MQNGLRTLKMQNNPQQANINPTDQKVNTNICKRKKKND